MCVCGCVVSSPVSPNTDHSILCVLPVIGQPRHAKRISMLKQAGFEVEAVAYERDYHRGRLPDCSIEILSKIEQGRYFRRILSLFGSLPALRRAISRNQLVYAFGLDMAFVAIIAGMGLGRPVFLEVGDIRRVQVSPGLKGRIVRMLDRYVAHTIKLLVSTAPGYVDGYYHNWLNIQPQALVIENKQEAADEDADGIEQPLPLEGKPFVDRPMRIGYFGLLRCDWSWQVLENLAESRTDDFEIVVAGRPKEPADLVERARRLPNVEYLGEYQSPADLPKLYGGVDLIWACYPSPQSGDWNWRWARTNRFYESCYYKKPMIALTGSGDAEEVEKLDIGISVKSDSEIKDVVDTLSMISPEDLDRWHENILRLSRDVYENSTEISDLAQAVRNIICNK